MYSILIDYFCPRGHELHFSILRNCSMTSDSIEAFKSNSTGARLCGCNDWCVNCRLPSALVVHSIHWRRRRQQQASAFSESSSWSGNGSSAFCIASNDTAYSPMPSAVGNVNSTPVSAEDGKKSPKPALQRAPRRLDWNRVVYCTVL